MLDRLLTGLAAQQKGTTARWYSNKTSLFHVPYFHACKDPNDWDKKQNCHNNEV